MDYNDSLELPLFHLSGEEEQADKLASLGRKCSEEGRFDEAVRVLEEAVQAVPDKPDYRVLIASAYQELVDSDASLECDEIDSMLDHACSHLLDALRYDPDYAPAYRALGFIYRAMEIPWKARESWNYYLEMEPHGTAAQEIIAALDEMDRIHRMHELCEEAAYRINHGEAEKALPLLAEVTAEHPDWHDAWFWTALACRELEMLDGSIKAFARASELEPDNPFALHELAALLVRKGELEAAEGFWKKALELSSEDPWIMENLALLLWRLERREESGSLMMRALDLNPANRKLLLHLRALRAGETAPGLDC